MQIGKILITNLVCFLLLLSHLFAQTNYTKPREHILTDAGWRFALGHPYNTQLDYNNGTGYFSYLTKTGYGDGAAAASFDDRSWRMLDLPHDWAVEQPFSEKGSYSHGFKAIGRNFPEASVGWYRKTITIPESDLGRKISIAFDGVFRNSIVWVNGHYLGTQPSGYMGFEYDITDYLNYGGENVIAVRCDVTMEEGWFYEGAGIYRHVWLNKTNPLHVATNGTFITSAVKNNGAAVTALVKVKNDGLQPNNFTITQTIVDAAGKTVATAYISNLQLKGLQENEYTVTIPVNNPKLWDIESPYLYKMNTTVKQGGNVADTYETNFGIRTIRFDANEGFFLNGKHVEIKGSNNHQDHAGVGVAFPDALQYFRISTLKAMGSNAYRCSHNPPTPELLEACDRLGMLVIDENRLMGINNVHLDDVKKLIERDRNHPSIISWSVGNEEWGIEGNITGARIATTMQAFAKTIDTTRAITAAISGGIGNGISTTIDLLGYNYIATKNTDEQHKKFPKQLSWGTEEGSTVTTRGEYVDDWKKHYLASYDKKQNNNFLSLEDGWKHYAARPYLAGMFIWTGFDYRGEPTPFGWPSVTSYFGMVDLCGLPKDNVWYLRSWWTDQPTLHILPHWNWQGKEGQSIAVWAYSNCDEVELFLNKKSLGKKTMEKNGHLAWQVNYAPGTLEAIGYKNGKKTLTDVIKTTGTATQLAIMQNSINTEKQDAAVFTLSAKDKNGLTVPIADNEMDFTIQGPARIIGVGNGDPTSLANEKFIETISIVKVDLLKEKPVESLDATAETSADFDDSNGDRAFKDDRTQEFGKKTKALIYRGSVDLPVVEKGSKVTFFYKSIGKMQSVYVNGKVVGKNLEQSKKGNEFVLDAADLKPGKNTITIVATPLLKNQSWDVINTDAGAFQILTPAAQWKRKLFNGFAQVIIQPTGEPGEVTLTAKTADLKSSSIKVNFGGN